MTTNSPPPPPGWYPAPHAGGEQRYWDGTGWLAAPPANAKVARPSNGWRTGAIIAMAVAGVLLVLWTVAYVSLLRANSESAILARQLEKSTGGDQSAELDQREAELDAREAEVTAREEAAGAWVTTVLNDGIYTIGVSAEPGVYRTESVGEYCQWTIYKTGTGIYDGEILNFGAGEPGPIQVTLPEGQDFSSSDCGTWNRIG